MTDFLCRALGEENRKKGMMFPAIAFTLTQIIYLAVSILSVYSFGTSILETSNVLNNVSELDTPESYILRCFYMIIAASHIPFIFYPGKEARIVRS